MGSKIPEEKLKALIAFHGHWCPGLATGIKISEVVLDELGRTTDEEIVAVASGKPARQEMSPRYKEMLVMYYTGPLL